MYIGLINLAIAEWDGKYMATDNSPPPPQYIIMVSIILQFSMLYMQPFRRQSNAAMLCIEHSVVHHPLRAASCNMQSELFITYT